MHTWKIHCRKLRLHKCPVSDLPKQKCMPMTIWSMPVLNQLITRDYTSLEGETIAKNREKLPVFIWTKQSRKTEISPVISSLMPAHRARQAWPAFKKISELWKLGCLFPNQGELVYHHTLEKQVTVQKVFFTSSVLLTLLTEHGQKASCDDPITFNFLQEGKLWRKDSLFVPMVSGILDHWPPGAIVMWIMQTTKDAGAFC